MRDGVHEINKNREQCGEFYNLYEKMRLYPTKFFEYTRMPISTFDYILSKISDKITKEDTNFRKSISPKEKLFITLRFQATLRQSPTGRIADRKSSNFLGSLRHLNRV
ncbi:unnamed protein product, partial [Leptidea sinapis]